MGQALYSDEPQEDIRTSCLPLAEARFRAALAEADAFIEEGLHEQAIPFLARAATLAPGSGSAREAVVRRCLRTVRGPLAHQLLHTLVCELGRNRSSEADVAEAQEETKRWQATEPESEEATVDYGEDVDELMIICSRIVYDGELAIDEEDGLTTFLDEMGCYDHERRAEEERLRRRIEARDAKLAQSRKSS